MALSETQVKELRKQLLDQVKHLPKDQKQETEEQIKEMSPEALESMLNQQKGRQQVFRMIANKEIESVVIAENSDAIAVLEINPLSKGHTLVIPKNPITKKEEMPKAVLKFAKEIIDKIDHTLKSKKVNLVLNEKFGEAVIDLIPVYDSEINENSERKQASKEDLEDIKKKINTEIIKKEPEKIKIIKEDSPKEKVKLKRRIP